MALVTMKELLERAKSNYRGNRRIQCWKYGDGKRSNPGSRRTGHSDHLADCRSKIETLPLALMGPMMVQAAKEAKVDVAVQSGSWTYHGDSRESTGTWIYLRHVRQLYISI